MGQSVTRRERLINRVKTRLLAHGNPRLQMFLILLFTGVAGFAASALLHWLGLVNMALRYPLAVALAYLAFIGMVGIWLMGSRPRTPARSSTVSVGDVADAASDVFIYGDPDPSILLPSLPLLGKSGPAGDEAASAGDTALKGLGKGIGKADGDGIVVLIVILLIVVAVGSALAAFAYVIWQAPALFAEVLIDGGLLVGFARRLRPKTEEHWTAGVVRRTWLPALAVAVIFGIVGAALQYFVPSATTMAEALKAVLKS